MKTGEDDVQGSYAIIDAIDRGHAWLAKQPAVAAFALIGSAHYLPNPADVDFAVLIRPDDILDPREWCNLLVAQGSWQHCSMYAQANVDEWWSVRDGLLNLMVTAEVGFYDRYLRAMEICRGAHITDKNQRIAICKMVRDGLSADDVLAGK